MRIASGSSVVVLGVVSAVVGCSPAHEHRGSTPGAPPPSVALEALALASIENSSTAIAAPPSPGLAAPSSAVRPEPPAPPPEDTCERPLDTAALRLTGADLPRATRPIEDPAGSMEHFYRRLAQVARREPDALARIAVYQDSINGTDVITSTVRRALQDRFGDGGKGWVPITAGWPTQAHEDVSWSYRAWRSLVVNRGRARDGRYGLGGIIAFNRGPGSMTLFGTTDEGPAGRAVSRYRLFYQAFPRGGSASLSVDGQAPDLLATAEATVEDRVHELTVDDGPHELRVAVAEGNLRLYGVVMERDGPGVVVDALMLIGARGRRLALFDAEHLARQVALREPDVLVFWLGGNDALSEYFNHEGFVDDYGAGIANARAGRPEASCLVVSVLDVGEESGGWTRRRVPRIVEAQREIAQAHGCAFLDMFEALGGEGTMLRWFRQEPRLAGGDYTHPTRAGAREIGHAFTEMLLRGFGEWLDRPGDAATPCR